ncbi:MAG TPA: hypothetical protein DDZ41_02055, partial [Flavobacterium sp.]|nr:hypothetical protein [Flavobacterium sp.]
MSLMHYNEKKLYAVLITKKDDDYTNYLMIFDIKTGEILKKEQVEAFDKSTADRYNNSRSIYHSNENFV